MDDLENYVHPMKLVKVLYFGLSSLGIITNITRILSLRS
jgi:hypothetical protein